MNVWCFHLDKQQYNYDCLLTGLDKQQYNYDCLLTGFHTNYFMLNVFFRVIPRRLNFTYRRFGTLPVPSL
jgi:hypothetical protein